MKFSSKISLCIFLAVALLISACSSGENTNQISNQASNQPSETNSNSIIAAITDPAELCKIIILPIMPEEADWREEEPEKQTGSNRAPAPNDRKMTAVLLYSAEDTPKLIALIETHK